MFLKELNTYGQEEFLLGENLLDQLNGDFDHCYQSYDSIDEPEKLIEHLKE
jgi:hypothetical protein